MKSECDRDLLRIATVGNRRDLYRLGISMGTLSGFTIAFTIRSVDPAYHPQNSRSIA